MKTVARTVAVPLFIILTVILLPAGLPGAASPCLDKMIVGRTSWVHVEELDLDYLARVDTGASITSLHATDFLIEKGSDDPRDNIGRTIHFLTVSSDGRYRRLKAEIAEIQTVISAQGWEKRYMVRLTLTAKGVTKQMLVNLRDRSHLKYKLLLGRDWLADDFLVDVDLEEEPPAGVVAEE